MTKPERENEAPVQSRGYTPGPWINCNNHVDDSSGLTLFRSMRPFEQLNPLDFRLAAAAPDLLEACKAYLQAMDKYGHPDKTDRLIRKAVAKAEGVITSKVHPAATGDLPFQNAPMAARLHWFVITPEFSW